MGGMFQAQPPQTVSEISPEFSPFAKQLVQALGGLLQSPGQGVTPLEEATIQGAYQQASPIQQLLDYTVQGGFLPGVGSSAGNPFLGSLLQGIEAQGDVARRQLASAAQRAGALSSTDYLQQAAGLESGLAQKRGELLSGLYQNERQNQLGAIPLLGQLAQQLLGFAGLPRQVSTEQRRYPLELGANVLGGAGRGTVTPGQPSPFASLLSGLAPIVGAFKWTF